jgi:hypothetical protein
LLEETGSRTGYEKIFGLYRSVYSVELIKASQSRHH